jgi:hypothetical protein
MPVRSGRPRCVNTPVALTTTVQLENDNGCKYSIRPDSGRTSSVALHGCCCLWGADMTETTRETPFRDIPFEQRPLLLVASGVEVATALREAADLEDAVRERATWRTRHRNQLLPPSNIGSIAGWTDLADRGSTCAGTTRS